MAFDEMPSRSCPGDADPRFAQLAQRPKRMVDISVQRGLRTRSSTTIGPAGIARRSGSRISPWRSPTFEAETTCDFRKDLHILISRRYRNFEIRSDRLASQRHVLLSLRREVSTIKSQHSFLPPARTSELLTPHLRGDTRRCTLRSRKRRGGDIEEAIGLSSKPALSEDRFEN